MNQVSWMFDWSILGPPLLAGLLIVSTHVVLGREVLRRGIIFIDLTIAQIAALGAITAQSLGVAEGGWGVQVAAGVAALLAGGVLSWTERRWHARQEALIGCLYVIAASAAILVLARSPHGAEQFTHLLTGQILWVSPGQLIPVAVLYALVLAAWFGGANNRPALFYLLFALAITASVQLAGVYLVFATLILPALATLNKRGWRGLAVAYALGAAAYGLGLWLSVPTDLPSGPLVVCVLAVLAAMTAGFTGSLSSLPAESEQVR